MDADAKHGPYASQRIMLLTQHGKEHALGPIVRDGLGASLEVVRGFDTDSLGTFTRDVPRAGTQLDAARAKARIAIERSGGQLGLGSEGAFNPGPFGIGCWNVELVLLADAARGIEVVGTAHGPGLHVHGTVATDAELRALAERAGFPEHGLVIRPEGPDDARVRKGIAAWAELARAFEETRRESPSGAVFVESDLRAHMHPSRMALIRTAGADLVARLSTACPSCGLPGFGLSEVVPGLPCAACGTQTQEPLADIHSCVRCDYREERRRDGSTAADPGHCPYCNP